MISLVYFKDLALFVFDFDGLHRGSLCFLKITSCKRVELPYISIFEFFSYCMHKCRKKFPHNVRQADSFARSYHSKVALLISELNWKVKKIMEHYVDTTLKLIESQTILSAWSRLIQAANCFIGLPFP